MGRLARGTVDCGLVVGTGSLLTGPLLLDEVLSEFDGDIDPAAVVWFVESSC